MASDLKSEIFAYKWFRREVFDSDLPRKFDVVKVYEDEYRANRECVEASLCNDLYEAIDLRVRLFQKLYLEEIQKQTNEFQHSQTDFSCYVHRTCNRDDLFGNLTIFDRVFATSAFVCCLCRYCYKNRYSEIMKYGYIHWARYFDNFTDEFYKLGGWTRLEMVAVSYRPPIDFLYNEKVEETADILIKMRKVINSFFEETEKIDHGKSISESWVKFYKRYMNGSSNNGFNQFTDKSHSNDIKHFSEAEDILEKLKNLCDPTASEINKTLGRKSTTNSLETSMANLNICDKYVNLDSKEETILISELKQNTTFVNLDSKSTEGKDTEKKNNDENRDDTREEQAKWKLVKSKKNRKKRTAQINSVTKVNSNKTADNIKGENNTILHAGMSSIGKDATKENHKIGNNVQKEDERKVITGAMKSTILTGQIHPTKKNTEKENSNKSQDNIRKEQKNEKKNTVLFGQKASTENNPGKKNSNKTPEDRKEQNELKIIRGDKNSASLSGQKPTAQKNTEKESRNKTQYDIKKEQEEWKGIEKITIPREAKNAKRKIKCGTRQEHEDEMKEEKGDKNNTILIGEMSSTRKNTEEENEKTKNTIRKEQNDGEVKYLLRMLLVLGDKQGISYVRKTSKFDKEFSA